MKRYLLILIGIILVMPISLFSASNNLLLNVYAQSRSKVFLWKERNRDPFHLPYGIRLLSPGEEAKPNKKEVKTKDLPGSPKDEPTSTQLPDSLPPALSLKAILISDHIRLAAIDQEIVSEGDIIAGERVLEIHPDKVILGKEEKRRTLYLPQSSILLKVEEK